MQHAVPARASVPWFARLWNTRPCSRWKCDVPGPGDPGPRGPCRQDA
ncbi:hypothetical protein PAI11_14840 [Patulibacter medicamentivorans]|uniref:Uncharacterized protein n=1 Tax=Patulibacter medicamentivorans TaxID=1097667 RepID=H0E3V9_9ACTN|nr:hypothetical protein PAI11_14840 [Patulibacter medicamentivorans]